MNDKHHSIKVDKPSGVKTLGNLYIGEDIQSLTIGKQQ